MAVLVFDGRAGRLRTRWGANRFAMPHGLTVDSKDNVWITDVALQQVFKFSHEGRPLLTIGEQGVPGTDGEHFDRPTKVAVAAGGSFYVSDGYRNSRVADGGDLPDDPPERSTVVVVRPDGSVAERFGRFGVHDGELYRAHDLAVSREGAVYVGDANGRVQKFVRNEPKAPASPLQSSLKASAPQESALY